MKRISLVIVLVVVALNAFGGGWYGISGAPDVPLAWLEGTPFASYLVPSILLLVVVGGTHLVAAVGMLRRRPWGQPATLAAGTVLLTWIAVQVVMIGYVSWLQPTMAAAGLFELCANARGGPSVRRRTSCRHASWMG